MFGVPQRIAIIQKRVKSNMLIKAGIYLMLGSTSPAGGDQSSRGSRPRQRTGGIDLGRISGYHWEEFID